MNKLALRNVLANKARLLLITFAVAIGVSFVSATFIFSDSLSQTFDGLANQLVEDVDLEVRPTGEFGTDGALNNAVVDQVRATDGVAHVGVLRDSEDVSAITPTGELASGIPIALSWIEHDGLRGFDIVAGQPPGDNEFMLGRGTATNDGFEIGETYRISTPTGVVERTLSGTAELAGGNPFGDEFAFTFFPLDDAQQIFGGDSDGVDAIAISLNDTATASSVQAALAEQLPNGTEVVSSRTVQEEQAASFNDQLSILRNVLLGFAVVSVFVSTFIIRNTFGIILSQRIRELGLLRAIGADGRQIERSVLVEAVAIGTIASAIGLVLGLAVTSGLMAVFRAVGAPLPDIDIVLNGRTVLIASLVGLGATITSAIGPARQARRISPVAALSGQHSERTRPRLRVAIGVAMVAIGITMGAFGLFGASGTSLVLTLLGGGIAIVFLGVTLMSPALASPIIAAIGAPLPQLAGTAGSLARENARRNPRRTANTAAALMIGLSLITTVLVVGQSVKSHLASTLDATVSADYVVSNDFDPMAAQIASDLAALPELDDVLPVSELAVEVNDDVTWAEALPTHAIAPLFDLGITEGQLPTDPGATAVLSDEMSIELGLGVGDTLTASFANGADATFEVVALYSDTTLIESGILLDRSTVTSEFPVSTVDWVAARKATGVDVEQATAALDRVSADWPQIAVQTSTDYRESVEAEIDSLLSIVNVLLALSIVIALIGIGLTLALSVFERTREIGLLRAVGMSTRQVRRMVRWEAALIGLFGAVLGVATGLLYGWGAVRALPDNITSALSIPGVRIGQLVIASAVAALLAAILPARRAGRLNVLDAISGRVS